MDVTVTINDKDADLVAAAYGHEGTAVPEPVDPADLPKVLAASLAERWTDEVSSVVLDYRTRSAVVTATETAQAEHEADLPVAPAKAADVAVIEAEAER
jgi:hypothetical protein